MARHHIIPKHEWKARFGSLKGVNAPDNLSPELYTEQHAQVHLHYFNEITHLECDRVAFLAITKQIGKEEAQIEAAKSVNSERVHSEESKKNHSQFMMGNKNALGHRKSEKWKLEQANRKKGLLKGYKHPIEFGKAIAIRMKGHPYPKVTCPHCGVEGGPGAMSLWHFDKCKKKL